MTRTLDIDAARRLVQLPYRPAAFLPALTYLRDAIDEVGRLRARVSHLEAGRAEMADPCDVADDYRDQ